MSFIAEILELIKLRCLGRMAVRLAFSNFCEEYFLLKIERFSLSFLLVQRGRSHVYVVKRLIVRYGKQSTVFPFFKIV